MISTIRYIISRISWVHARFKRPITVNLWPDLKWPLLDPTMMTPKLKATNRPNLVHVGSRVNEVWPWPWNDLGWPQVNFLNIFEIWPQMTFWPWSDPTMMTPGSKAIHGPNLVHMGSRVNKLWPWPRNDLGWPQVNFLNIFEIWPQMTFWPWPDPTMMTPGSKAIHGPNLVHVGSRVNELWPWPRNDLRWPQVNFLNIFEIWPQMTFWPWMTLTTPPKSFAAHPEPEPLHVTKFQPRRPYGSRDMPQTAHGARRTADGAQAKWMLCLCLRFSGETKRERTNELFVSRKPANNSPNSMFQGFYHGIKCKTMINHG